MKDCIFCKIVKGEFLSEKIFENDKFFSIFDVAPQVKGHALVISKEHFETMVDMPNELSFELLDCIKKTATMLMEKFDCTGFNILNNTYEVAGQIIKHVHFHVLLRKKDGGYFVSLEKR